MEFKELMKIKTIDEIKDELLNMIHNDIKEKLNSKKELSFSWESYFKFYLWDKKCMTFLLDNIQKELNDQNFENIYLSFLNKENENNEIKKEIQNIKNKLIEVGKLKQVSFSDKEKEIIMFFKEKRNVLFLELNPKERNKCLVDEDILQKEDSIFNYLNITHMQYKYLYQIGVFLTDSFSDENV